MTLPGAVYETASRLYHQLDLPETKEQLQNGNPLDGVVLVVAATTGPTPQTSEQIQMVKQGSVSSIVVFLNWCDVETDEKSLGLVESKVREMLTSSDYPGQDVPTIRGSALKALEYGIILNEGSNPEGGTLQDGDDTWAKPILKLGDALDSYIPKSKQA